MATTLVVVDATTVVRTGAQAPTYQDHKPLADTSSMPPSHRGTDHRPTSRNTLGKQTSDYGSRITGLLAKPVEQKMMISLSATFHCS